MWAKPFRHLKKIGLRLPKVIAYMGIFLGILLLTLAVSLFLSNISPIRERLINYSQQYLLSKGVNITINGLKGFFPFRFSVKDFSYKDTTTHIEIKDASIISTFDIKQARLLITQTNIQSAAITVYPDTEGSSRDLDLSKELEDIFTVQRFLFMEHLKVQNLLFKTPNYTELTPYSLTLDLESSGALRAKLFLSHPTTEDRIYGDIEVTKKAINTLDIKVSISEKSPIAELLGLKNQFKLAVSQDKALPNQADFKLSLVNFIEARGKILFEDFRKNGIAITSHLLINDERVEIFEPGKEFDLRFTIRPASGEKYIFSGTLDSTNLHVIAEGREVSLSHPFGVDYSMKLKEGFQDPRRIWKVGKSEITGSALIHQAVKRIEGKINIAAFSYDRFGIRDVALEANIENLSRHSYEAVIKSLRFEVLNQPAFLEHQTIQIEGKVLISPSEVKIYSLKANSKDLDMDLKGGFSIQQKTSDLQLALSSKREIRFAKSMGFLNPACDLSIRFKESASDRKDFTISGTITGFQQNLFRSEGAKNRERIAVDTVFSLENADTLKIQSLNIQHSGIVYALNGSLSIKTFSADLGLNVAFSDLNLLDNDLIHIKKGSLTALLKGTPSSFVASSQINLKGSFKQNPYELNSSPLKVAVKGDKIESNAEIKGLLLQVPFYLKANYSMKDHKTWMLNVNADVAQNPLLASFSGREKTCDGTIDISIKGLSELSSLLGQTIKGHGQANIQVSLSDKSEIVKLKTNLNDLNFDQVLASRVNLDAVLTNMASRQLELSCKIADLRTSKQHFGDLEIAAKSQDKGYFVSLSSKGGDILQRFGGRFFYLPVGNHHVFDISFLEASIVGEELFLKSPGRIEIEKDKISLSSLQFVSERALVQLGGILGQEESNFSVSWNDLKLLQFRQLLDYEINGSCSGNIFISGGNSNPNIRGEVNFDGLSISQVQYMPSYKGNLLFNLSGDKLIGSFKLMHDNSQILLVEAQIPINVSLFPFSARYEAHSVGHFYVGSDADLEMLGLSHIFPGKNIRGKLRISADLNVQNKAYDMKGRLEISEFEFVSIREGVFVKDSTIGASFLKDKIVIDRLLVRDHQKGVVEGKGEVQFAEEGFFVVSVALNLQGFRPISQKGIEMKLSGNTLLGGDLDNLLLQGDLNIDSLVIDIDQLGTSTPKELNVVEIRYPGEKRYRLPITNKDPLERLKVDLNVRSPKTVRLKGKDLDSLWKGELHIQGSASAPQILGAMELEKGRYILLGKPFLFTSGKIYFEGQNPPRPYVIARAEAGRTGSKAFAEISGPIDDLKLTLSSESDVPPGEALSRVLFGKSLSSLSPMQGLKVAELLSGGKEKMPLFNIMSLPERLFKLDTLSVEEESTEKGKLIRAGKFLNDRIYLEFDWGLEAEKGRVRVNMELTPHIELQTHMGEKGAGAEVNFRWDY